MLKGQALILLGFLQQKIKQTITDIKLNTVESGSGTFRLSSSTLFSSKSNLYYDL